MKKYQKGEGDERRRTVNFIISKAGLPYYE